MGSKQDAVALNAANAFVKLIQSEEVPLEGYTVEDALPSPNVVNIGEAAIEAMRAKADSQAAAL